MGVSGVLIDTVKWRERTTFIEIVWRAKNITFGMVATIFGKDFMNGVKLSGDIVYGRQLISESCCRLRSGVKGIARSYRLGEEKENKDNPSCIWPGINSATAQSNKSRPTGHISVTQSISFRTHNRVKRKITSS